MNASKFLNFQVTHSALQIVSKAGRELPQDCSWQSHNQEKTMNTNHQKSCSLQERNGKCWHIAQHPRKKQGLVTERYTQADNLIKNPWWHHKLCGTSFVLKVILNDVCMCAHVHGWVLMPGSAQVGFRSLGARVSIAVSCRTQVQGTVRSFSSSVCL
jgi:hypothetical protein